MIRITVDSYSNGVVGRRYKSVKEAIDDCAFSPFDEARIRRQFNFGEGTEKDFKRYCGCNKVKVLSLEEFHKIAGHKYDKWIKERLSH